jgi:flagellar hook assembly protein FlgD
MSNTVTSINSQTTPSTSNVNANGKVATEPAGGQTLTQADFLKIMVAQFTQQDPLSSGDGSSGGSGTSDYVNQLMSMTNLTTLQTMSGQQAQQLVASLPGQTVTVSDNGQTASGVVSSARVNAADGGVYFTVDGQEFPSADLYSINQVPVASSSTATTPTSN